MMALGLLLAIAQASAEPAPRVDLATLPLLPWRTTPLVTPDVGTFVAGEVRAGRCDLPPGALPIDVVVLVRSDGVVRKVVPHAIGCATVEQFAAGLVTRFARGNLRPLAAGWYRATIVVPWSR